MAQGSLSLKFLGSALVVLLSLSGCSGPEALDSSRVDPDAVWAKYMLEYDADTRVLLAAAQFRLKNESGAVIRLKEPSSVFVDGSALGLTSGQSESLALSGNFYSLNLAAAAPNQQFTFTWTRPDSKKVTNAIARIPELRLKNDSVPQKQNRRTQLSVFIEGWDAISSDVAVTCFLESRVADVPAEQLATSNPQAQIPGAGLPPNPPSAAGVGSVIGAPAPSPTPAPTLTAAAPGQGVAAEIKNLSYRVPFGAPCLFTADQLQNFRRGPARLRVLAEKTDTSISGHPKGGLLNSRTWGAAGLIEISE